MAPACDNLHTNIRKGESPDALFRFLDRFETSRATTAAFKKEFERGAIKLEPLTDEAKKLSSANTDIAAVFDIIGNTPTLFLNSLTEESNDELGVVAVLLFHEIVHAMDAKYAKRIRAYRKKQVELKLQDKGYEFPSAEWFKMDEAWTAQRRKRNEMVFDAERLAYDEQSKLLVEIMKKIDCAKGFYDYQEQAERMIVSRYTDKEIRETYVILP